MEETRKNRLLQGLDTFINICRYSICVGFLLVGFSQYSSAAIFTSGNVLASHDQVLYEYSLSGDLVQQIPIPHPDTSRYDAVDVVTDRAGRALILNIAPFDNDYLSIYTPSTNSWEHVRIIAFFGNTSDGDLSILKDFVYTKNLRINLETNFASSVDIPGRGVAEISAGFDGLLYALDSGSPRHGVRVLDPESLDIVREFELLDNLGSRIDARGISVSADGKIYVLTFDGDILVYSSTGVLELTALSLITRTADLDLREDGTLIGGGDDGQFFIHTVDELGVSNPMIVDLPSSSFDSTYVAFVDSPVISEAEAEAEAEICFPIRARNRAVVLICL